MAGKTVEVRSAWLSKINWTQVAPLVASFAAAWGLNFSTEQILAIVLGIQALQSVVTIILRTLFTTTVTGAVAASLPEGAKLKTTAAGLRCSPLAVLFAVGAVFLLGGCQSTWQTWDKADAAIRQHIEKVCTGIELMHVAAISFAEVMKPSTVAAELAAYQQSRPICLSPGTASTVKAVETLARVSVAVLAALREAEAAEDAAEAAASSATPI